MFAFRAKDVNVDNVRIVMMENVSYLLQINMDELYAMRSFFYDGINDVVSKVNVDKNTIHIKKIKQVPSLCVN